MAQDNARSTARYRNPWGFLIFLAALPVVLLGMAYWGYDLGQRALKDVSVPTTVPTVPTTQEQAQGFIRETDILTRIAQQMERLRLQGFGPVPLPSVENSGEVDLNTSDIFQEPEVIAADQTESSRTVSNDQVTLEVTGVERIANLLVLDLSLTNQGSDDLRFLYADAFNALLVSDEQKRRLSTSTSGLPPDLPADGSAYSGSIEIPLDEIGDSRYLRLSLSDYKQQVNLVIPAIKLPR